MNQNMQQNSLVTSHISILNTQIPTYRFVVPIVSCFTGGGLKVMDRKRRHPADHGALLALRLNNGGVDVSLLKSLDCVFLTVPLQALMQPIPSEAFVVAVEVDPLQDQPQSRSFGHIHLVLPPAPFNHFLLRVALYHRNHQANHLADLVQHEALASHGDHRKLGIAADKRLSAGHLCDVAAGAGVIRSLLGGEVVEVVSAFVESEQTVHSLKCFWLQAKVCYTRCVIVLWGEGHCWKHVGVRTSITVVFRIETLGHPLKTCGGKYTTFISQ